MAFEIDPSLIQNDDIRITTNVDGALQIEHVKNGNTLTLTVDGTLVGPDGDEVGGTGTTAAYFHGGLAN